MKRSKQYNKEHKEKVAVWRLEWNEKYRERHRELSRLIYARNPEKAKKYHTDQNRKRRAQKYNNKIDVGITLDKVYERDNGICGICSEVCRRIDASLDHKIPLSKGGEHTWVNVQLAHFNCNARKGNRI